jgi:hypothetical protein
MPVTTKRNTYFAAAGWLMAFSSTATAEDSYVYGSQVDMCDMADVFLWLDSLEGDMGTACNLLIAQGITDIPPRTVYCDCYDLVPDEMAEEKFGCAFPGGQGTPIYDAWRACHIDNTGPFHYLVSQSPIHPFTQSRIFLTELGRLLLYCHFLLHSLLVY